MRTARTDSMWNQARVLGGSAALLLVITLASNALAQPRQCPDPPPDQAFEDFYHPFVRVYTEPNFKGICQMLPINTTIANLGDPPFELAGDLNNTIRSIKVGRSVRLRLFDGTDFSGDWDWWENSRESLEAWNWNARASSLRVEDRAIRLDCSNLPSNTVAIYEHADFGGDCRVLSPGCYNGAKQMGFENDSLSSIRNRAGEVTLYADAHFRSPLPPPDADYTNPIPCFWPVPCHEYKGGLPTIKPGEDWEYIGDDLNDATTSICIDRE
jgi:hypothetical protein